MSNKNNVLYIIVILALASGITSLVGMADYSLYPEEMRSTPISYEQEERDREIGAAQEKRRAIQEEFQAKQLKEYHAQQVALEERDKQIEMEAYRQRNSREALLKKPHFKCMITTTFEKSENGIVFGWVSGDNKAEAFASCKQAFDAIRNSQANIPDKLGHIKFAPYVPEMYVWQPGDWKMSPAKNHPWGSPDRLAALNDFKKYFPGKYNLNDSLMKIWDAAITKYGRGATGKIKVIPVMP